MFTATSTASAAPLSILLRGEPDALREWIEHWGVRRVLLCVGIILVGAGLYGAAMGYWRDGY